MFEGDLKDEEWREYDFVDENGNNRIYRIDNPSKLFYREGGTTHRVLDSEGVIHCVPVPGRCQCVLRWKSRDGENPVAF